MTTQSVTESKEGTMSKPGEQTKVSLSEQDKIPAGVSKVSSDDTPKYSQSEFDTAIHAAKSEVGREKKALEIERDGFKTKFEAKEAELTDNAAEIDKLQEKFDAMASDDPAKFDVAKELKAAREERRQLKADRLNLEARDKVVTKWERDQLVFTVADEFSTATGEDVDFDAFKDAADKFKLNEREGLVALAETMGFKLKTEPKKLEEPPLKLYSAKTDGGSEDLSQLSPREKIDRGIEKAKGKGK